MQVSIICPVYNAAASIKACIDSILQQTLQDWEVIFVDDHGQDDAVAVARAYVAGRGEAVAARFRFLATPSNGGPGAARNVGLAAAKGEYVAFVDADDLLAPRMLERLVLCAYGGLNLMHIGTPGVDVVCCNAQSFTASDVESDGCSVKAGSLSSARLLANPPMFLHHPENTRLDTDPRLGHNPKLEYLLRFKTYLWTYIYRREFLLDQGLRFLPLRSSEDTNFLLRTLMRARSIRQISDVLYYYRLQESSLSNRPDAMRYRDKLEAMADVMADYQAMVADERYSSLHLEQYRDVMDYLYLKKGFAVSALNYLRDASSPSSSMLVDIRNQMRQKVPSWSGNCYLNRDCKLLILCSMLARAPRLSGVLLPPLVRRLHLAL